MKTQPDVPRLIAAAQIPPFNRRGHALSASSMKAVLLVLWAHEGERISMRAIADRAGVCDSIAWLCTVALETVGLVRVVLEASAQRPKAYAVVVEELRRNACTTPLSLFTPARPVDNRLRSLRKKLRRRVRPAAAV